MDELERAVSARSGSPGLSVQFEDQSTRTGLMGIARVSVRLPLFCLFLAVSSATLLLFCVVDRVRRRPVNRAPFTRGFLTVLCRLLGFRIHIHGHPLEQPALLVSNHVSWTDIAVLGSCSPVCFLAKREVRRWPLIGWVAQQIGTVFIERSAGRTAEVRAQIGSLLRQKQQVIIFPEGTTTDGTAVRPFHRPLLAAAIEACVPVQAITLAYRRNGAIDRIVPFVGEDAFQRHLPRVLSQRALEVHVIFHPPVFAEAEDNPGRLAKTLHLQVSEGLGQLHKMIRTGS
ncbi:MAG: 1-acyl-sn-glycerol-3-phosphate acyltransferase [Alteromonadaceae bacterium]|nr:1-acyl-sn-glycerol-3-phosphate acyltransferase [Alteromonadaceae bacterium]|tara:strand:+ start:3379 stop:4236 length:858 start_codon:yes stop_codon:yes gene_type:complete